MYQLNSGKDSRGDEHLFMQAFEQNRAAIEAYKKQHGGDLEHAFQAVTGTPWPSGRSVKIHGGVPEMTKDRTVASVLGKYVAPIAAGVAAPFVLPALVGAGGAAGAVGAAGSAGAAGTAAGAGTLASTTIGSGFIPAIAGGSGLTGAASAGGGMGLWGSFLKSAAPEIVSGGAQIAGAKMGAGAVKDAAKIQAESEREALALQERMYNQDRSDLGQNREDLAPFRALGGGAAGLLGQGLGIQMPPAQSMASPTAQANASPMSALSGSIPGMQTGQRPMPEGAPVVGQAMPKPGMEMAAQQQSQSGYASMLSPSGQRVRVPANMVQQAIAQGGKVVA